MFQQHYAIEYTGDIPTLPENERVLVPLCVTRDELLVLVSAAFDYAYRRRNGGFDPSAYTPLLQAMQYISNPELSGCLPDAGSGLNGDTCYRMFTYEDAIKFFYNDPFISIDEQDRAKLGKWERWADAIQRPPNWLNNLIGSFGLDDVLENIGYFDNDCFVVPPDTTGNPFAELADLVTGIINLEIPKIQVKMRGSGRFGVELLTVPFGGTAMLRWDSNLSLSSVLESLFNGGELSGIDNHIFTELNRELFQIPPQLLERNSIEIDFQEDGEHLFEVYFLPRFGGSLTNPEFLGMGGGIRSITACGTLEIYSVSDDSIINRRNYGTRSAREGVINVTAYGDLCKAVECGIINVFARAVAGSGGNLVAPISIQEDENGNFTFTKQETTLSGLPTIVTDNKNEVLWGAAMGVGEGFRDLVGEIFLYRDTQNRTAQAVADLLRNFFLFVPIVDAIDILATQTLADKYTNANDQVTPAVDVIAIAKEVFCKGANKQALYRYALAVETSSGTDAVDIAAYYNSLIDQLSDEQIQQWFDAGLNTPRTGYTVAPCYRQPSVTYVWDDPSLLFDGSSTKDFANIITMQTKPINNVWRITFSGYFDNITRDERWTPFGWYDSAGNPTAFSSSNVYLFIQGNRVSSFFSPFPVPVFSGNYTYEHKSDGAQYIRGLRLQVLNTWDTAIDDIAGELQMRIDDLGVR